VECLIISQLLVLMPDCYGDGPDPTRRRAMQRDLDELARDGLIEVVNPGGAWTGVAAAAARGV
jgi:hypothetical protein